MDYGSARRVRADDPADDLTLPAVALGAVAEYRVVKTRVAYYEGEGDDRRRYDRLEGWVGELPEKVAERLLASGGVVDAHAVPAPAPEPKTEDAPADPETVDAARRVLMGRKSDELHRLATERGLVLPDDARKSDYADALAAAGVTG